MSVFKHRLVLYIGLVFLRGKSSVIDITMIGSAEWEYEGKLNYQFISQEPKTKKSWHVGLFKSAIEQYG
jgi:hypothetical protein